MKFKKIKKRLRRAGIEYTEHSGNLLEFEYVGMMMKFFPETSTRVTFATLILKSQFKKHQELREKIMNVFTDNFLDWMLNKNDDNVVCLREYKIKGAKIQKR